MNIRVKQIIGVLLFLDLLGSITANAKKSTAMRHNTENIAFRARNSTISQHGVRVQPEEFIDNYEEWVTQDRGDLDTDECIYGYCNWDEKCTIEEQKFGNGGGDDPINGGGDDPINGGGDDPINGGGDDPINGGGDDPINGGKSSAFDITLVAETSSFSGKDNWLQTTKIFLRTLANIFKIQADKVHMSLLFFDNDSRPFIGFNEPESVDKKAFLDKIDSITADDVGNNHNVLYCDALFTAIEDMLFEEGTRPDANKAAVLITYGYDNGTNRSMIPDVVEAYKTKRVVLVTVSMDAGGNEDMYLLAGCENNAPNCPNSIVVSAEYLASAARQVKVQMEKDAKKLSA